MEKWPAVLTEHETAEITGIRDLPAARAARAANPSRCPPFMRIGRSIRYWTADVFAWVVERRSEEIAERWCESGIDPDARAPIGVALEALPEVIDNHGLAMLCRLSSTVLLEKRKLLLDGHSDEYPPHVTEDRVIRIRLADAVAWMRSHVTDESLSDRIARRGYAPLTRRP